MKEREQKLETRGPKRTEKRRRTMKEKELRGGKKTGSMIALV